ncbi:hypothetical protein QFZ42_001846 [Variovorax paradoxus]|nr:hypothetical protein [Variovorax paradoxus]
MADTADGTWVERAAGHRGPFAMPSSKLRLVALQVA